jgi:hypothetical protein
MPGLKRRLRDECKDLFLKKLACFSWQSFTSVILRVGREYGLKAVRLPYELFWASWRAARECLMRQLGTWLLLGP